MPPPPAGHLSPLGIAAIVLVAVGLFLLASRANGPEVWAALAVAATIGAYSVSDAKGIRSTDNALYALAAFVGTGTTTTVFGLLTGRAAAMRSSMAANWRRYLVLGIASSVTYGLVQLAFRKAPVGYVTALRESSVVIAAFAGSRVLGEAAGRRRIVASLVVVAGLITLVVAR